MFPPHLPPPTCSIEQHHKWQRLKVLLVATFFGLGAGLSGAAILVGWIWPTLGQGDTWIVSRSHVIQNKAQVDEQVAARVRDSVFTVYSKSGGVSGKDFVVAGQPIASAVGVLSQGWVASVVPTTVKTSDIVLVAENGLTYQVTDEVQDKTNGISYLKINRLTKDGVGVVDEQLRTVAFADTLSAASPVVVYYNGTWFTTTVIDTDVLLTTNAHSLGVVSSGYRLAESFPAGSVVIDSNGGLAGFTTGGTTVVPFALASHTIVHLADAGVLSIQGLGVEGWFNEERPLVVNGERTQGFAVAKVTGKATPFKKGDILLTVNGLPMTRDNWLQVAGASSVRLTVLRNGETLDVAASIINE